jgi:hypothetical protein
MYVRNVTYVGGVIYGIYGVRSWEIRPDFNDLIIGDKQSSPTARRRARRSAHFGTTSMESMRCNAADLLLVSMT